ncbi:MAG: MurT ligase domain-containing protein [Solirubrobacteraceae bacterium]
MRDGAEPVPPIGADRTLCQRVWLEGCLEEHLDAVYNGPGDGSVLLRQLGGAPLTYTKLALARAVGRTNRAAGRGGGTAAPGRLLLKLAPRAITRLADRLSQGVVLVSATNGKTTTARMLASILTADGRQVVHNRAGSNTNWGVATALAEGEGEIGVFEVDEAWLPLLCAHIIPRLVVLGNLSRDRLDGYGELEQLVTLWRRMVRDAAGSDALVLNADDPLLAGPGGVLDGARPRAVTFGVDDVAAGGARPEHPHEAHSCVACGGPLAYSRAFVGHLGHYRCPRCARSRPRPDVAAVRIAERGLDGSGVTIALSGDVAIEAELAQPGLHNVHNALAATAAAVTLGVAADAIAAGLANTRAPFGRAEHIAVGERHVHLCLAKNPAGVNATLRVLGGDRRVHPLHLWIALNDGDADGRDVSWIWDCDFERLRGQVAAATCSGRRAHELALRIKCAEWACRIDVDPDLDAGFELALRRAPDVLVALPTYSALLDLRAVLNRRGVSVTDWGMTAHASH